LLAKQSEVVTIDRTAHYLILVNDQAFSEHAVREIGKVCGSCTVIPIRTPEGTKIKDLLALFPIK
jgi:hypothetical protein